MFVVPQIVYLYFRLSVLVTFVVYFCKFCNSFKYIIDKSIITTYILTILTFLFFIDFFFLSFLLLRC